MLSKHTLVYASLVSDLAVRSLGRFYSIRATDVSKADKPGDRLVLSGPVVVTLAPPLAEERGFLLEQVCAQADEVIAKELPVAEFLQPTLF